MLRFSRYSIRFVASSASTCGITGKYSSSMADRLYRRHEHRRGVCEHLSVFRHLRDSFLRLEGPGTSWLQRVFIEDWNFATSEDLAADRYLPVIPVCGQTTTQIVWSGPDQLIKPIREVLFAVIMRARQRVWITTPYLVPDTGLLDALCLAARTGRDVRILLPFRPDKWIPFLAGRYYWGDLLSAGVKIYQYTPGFIHAKVVIADDDWGSVGSANFDNRSLFLNFELNCVIESPGIVKELEEQFLADLAVSIRVESTNLRSAALSAGSQKMVADYCPRCCK